MDAKLLVVAVFLGLAGAAPAAPAGSSAVQGPELGSHTFSDRELRDLKLVVVQNEGRLKPLDTLARATVRFVTERSRYRAQDPIVTYLSWAFEGGQWLDEPVVEVRYLPLRRQVGLDSGRVSFSMRELNASARLLDLLRAVEEKERRGARLTAVESEAGRLGAKFVELEHTVSGEALRVIPNPVEPGEGWLNFQEASQAQFADARAARDTLLAVIVAFRGRDGARLATSASALRAALARIAPQAVPSDRALQSEYRYNRLNPFHKALVLYSLAFLVLLPSVVRLRRPLLATGLGLLLLGFAVHVWGEVLRVAASGRMPVANIYESLVFVAGAIVFLGLAGLVAYRAPIFALTASGLAAVTLALVEHLPIDPDISPLGPGLGSNTWLTLHVPTILCGYSAAFLAAGLAFTDLGAQVLGRADRPGVARFDRLHCRVVQATALFLGAGIVLGGLWAKQSWGRYWGWDPKETLALVSLLVYLAIVHGRYAGWLRRFGTDVASVIGFNLVIMTYYGANYFLVGRHDWARGRASDYHVPVAVYLFLAAQVALVLLAHRGPPGGSRNREFEGQEQPR